MQLPSNLLESLNGLPGFNQEDFVATHQSAQPITSIRLNPAKSNQVLDSFAADGVKYTRVPWTKNGYYLNIRPSFTFDPLFHAGNYYVQEASSMFIEQALAQLVDLNQPLKVLDLCAAPGGKSTHIQSLLSQDSLLVSNEVIKQRVTVLRDNIVKWGTQNVMVTHNDSKDFSKLKHYFDVIIVDAPCSGSGLFRKDPEAINEWSDNNVILCSQRQQRVLANALPALKEGGLLVYATCSYSQSENEHIVDWLTKSFPLSSLPLALMDDWNITEVTTAFGNKGYRFWPHLVKGEGFFLSAFKKIGGSTSVVKAKSNIKSSNKELSSTLPSWIELADNELIQAKEKVYAWPSNLFSDFGFLLHHLRVIYSGTLLGEFAHKKLIPDHALAMSLILTESIVCTDLALEEAITYLQKNTISLSTKNTGWQLATYKNQALGWMNVLPNRINNYYPKELRILKQKN